MERPEHLRGPNQDLIAYLIDLIWGGEYDAPGFIPREGDRVIDIGANVGVWSLLAASRGAGVVAYEPHPDTFTYLVANASRAGVECHQAAVVSEAPAGGHTSLYVHPTHHTRHTLFGADLREGNPLPEAITVPAVELADVLNGGCDLLKVDCEGAEFDLFLHSPPDTFRGVDRVIVEVHDHAGAAADVVSRLGQLGFDVSTRRNADEPVALLFATRR